MDIKFQRLTKNITDAVWQLIEVQMDHLSTTGAAISLDNAIQDLTAAILEEPRCQSYKDREKKEKMRSGLPH